MSSFVPPFSPAYLMPYVKYPVTETQMLARAPEKDGSLNQLKELMVESTTYDNRGRVVSSQSYTVERWA